jgi:hypothetical protein
VQYSDKIARLDNFAIQLQNEPNTRGFIIVYRTRRDLPGLSNRYGVWMKSYMTIARGLPKERIVTVDGGEAECLRQELWVVPIGATPKPRTDAYSNSFASADVPWKFDEYYFPSEDTSADEVSYGNLDEYMDAFGNALRREPKSRAYIIAYAQYYVEQVDVGDAYGNQRTDRRVHLDPQGTAAKILQRQRAYLVRSLGISPSKIKVIDGGYRNLRGVELWIVPPGASAPIPTPNKFPRARKRR